MGTESARHVIVIVLRAVAAVTLALASSCPAWADFSGRVVAVFDGDTLTVQTDHRQVRVQLAEIDAPELKQPFGQQSRKSLADLCLDKDAVVREIGYRNGHSVGRVACSGTDASAEQVHRGMAWVYRRYVESTSPLYFLEDEAQRAHEGLWSEKTQVAPWIWRRDQRHRPR
jgi:endonuclease YncB( thermonuclease family)